MFGHLSGKVAFFPESYLGQVKDCVFYLGCGGY